jgi:dTMP kinase
MATRTTESRTTKARTTKANATGANGVGGGLAVDPVAADGPAWPALQRPHDYPGTLIVVEGVDGSGKSTQLTLLGEWLERQGVDLIRTEWTSSTLIGKATKRGKRRESLGALSFVLLHATDFTHRYENIIVPSLKAGKVVLADRYVYTAMARDVARGADPSAVRALYSFAVKPDLALYFRVPLEVAIERVLTGKERGELKYYEAGLDLGLSTDRIESYKLFQRRVSDQYDRMVDEFGLTLVNAERTIEVQHHEVTAMAQDVLDRRPVAALV